MSRFLLGGVALLLAACSTAPLPVAPKPLPPGQPAPAPVMPTAPALPPASQDIPPATPGLPPTPPAVAQPPRHLADGSRVPAVQSLLQTAQQQIAAGSLPAAAASLERAQRLAPQSWLVYARLADVRLRQSRPAEAEQMARKALGFAPSTAAQAQSWRLIARARQQQGNAGGAQAAQERAEQLEAMPTRL